MLLFYPHFSNLFENILILFQLPHSYLRGIIFGLSILILVSGYGIIVLCKIYCLFYRSIIYAFGWITYPRRFARYPRSISFEPEKVYVICF